MESVYNSMIGEVIEFLGLHYLMNSDSNFSLRVVSDWMKLHVN